MAYAYVGSTVKRMHALNDTDVLAFTSAAQWESWLVDQHEQSKGVWLLIAKKGSDKVSVTISDALDVALCFGWIDGQRKSYDVDYYLQRYSPRRLKSSWSKLNVDRVDRLIATDRMRPRGLAEVAAAKADGRWVVAYEPQRDFQVPPDFVAALQHRARAKDAFEQLDKTGQYTIILPILKATTSESRAKSIRKTIAKLDEGN